MARYFSTVTSKSTFNSRFKAENGKTFAELQEVAASSWERPHLLACRVMRQKEQANTLPILSQDAAIPSLQSLPNEIKAFLQGPDPTFMKKSEHFLVRSSSCVSLAHIWAAMARFYGTSDRRTQELQDQNESDNHTEERPLKRLRQGISQPDFTEVQVGSSPAPSQASSQAPSVGYIDPKTYDMCTAPEGITLRLASCVIRHILFFAPPQDSASNSVVVEFRDPKLRLAPKSPISGQHIVAIDDGGLCLRQKASDGKFVLAKSHIAILEAKAQFQCLENGQPIISDNCLAQMVREALAVRLSDLTDKSRRIVIVIKSTQHYMCLLQMDLSDDYILDFDSTTPSHMLNVISTPWFDLTQKSGREHVLANLIGIMHRGANPA
ncbi:hypothetical protein BJX63DRAFT_297993 [Aspergillus granulosus]|uniref:Uncharacterized protein n=1 Tax=Aspergillus granulosus TaxID=176169 RepID=A0ABR4H683_9EURO